SSALLTYRFVQAGMRVWRGEQDLLVESHEADDEAELKEGAK
ncbi:MAG: C4-dicarboxylate transporter DctQ subunit, partial [bacterium]